MGRLGFDRLISGGEARPRLKSKPLMRRFLVFYVGFSLVPFGLLFFLFSQYGVGSNLIGVSQVNLGILILLVGAACLLGFISMHSILSKFVALSENVQKTLLGKPDRALLSELVKDEGEVADIAKSFNVIVTQLEDNIKKLEAAKETLQQVLTKVGNALTSMEDLDSLIRLTLETAIEALGASDGVIFSQDEKGRFEVKALVTEKKADAAEVEKALQSYLTWSTGQNQVFVLSAFGEPESPRRAFSPPLVCAPLTYRGNILGAICVSGKKSGGSFTEDELSIVRNLSCQIAVSFENVRLNEDRERIYFDTISALALAVEARDPYSRGHSERVGEVAARIGALMGLPEAELQTLRDASRLHDIGKIGITDSILLNPGRLGVEDMEIMKRHPSIGENIVGPLKTFKHLMDPVRHHHERLDGSGYPDALGGEQIPLITRIIMVADIYDAMTKDRPYRKALAWDTAKAEFDVMVRDGKLDPEVIRHLYTAAGQDNAPSPGAATA